MAVSSLLAIEHDLGEIHKYGASPPIFIERSEIELGPTIKGEWNWRAYVGYNPSWQYRDMLGYMFYSVGMKNGKAVISDLVFTDYSGDSFPVECVDLEAVRCILRKELEKSSLEAEMLSIK